MPPPQNERWYEVHYGEVVNKLFLVEMKLAKRLHETMEHLDPSSDASWDALSEREREFYRLCVDALIEDGDSVRKALDLSDYDEVSRCSQ